MTMFRVRPQAPLHQDVSVKKDSNSRVKEVMQIPVIAVGSEGTESIALFDRSEIKTGALVGSGSFSEVFEISSFSQKNSKKYYLSSSVSPTRRRKRTNMIKEHEENLKDLYSGKSLKSRFVIKQLHKKLLDDPKLFRRAVKDMATEVAVMSSIEHAHITKLHATASGGTDALAKSGKHDSYFLVLDRLVQTLEDRIDSWNLEKIRMGPSYYLDSATNQSKMALKANYALQIASALQYLHEHRIIYRDLKPQNIGFKEVHSEHPEKDVLALFDFGLARKLPPVEKADEEGLFHMSMVGTRRYMSPEVVIHKQYDERADVYSFALVFYELATQTRPYDGIQREDHKQLVCKEGKRPKIYSYFGFPAELEKMMKLAWSQEVSLRLSMKEICETLEMYLAGTIHEGCVRQKDTNTSVETPEERFSSSQSVDTHQTEQTLSTANSLVFSLGESSTKEEGVSESGAEVGPGELSTVIHATMNRAATATTEQEELEPQRRLSYCQRSFGAIRRGIAKLFAKCFR